MRIIATLLISCIALSFSSCSKQPIEDETQSVLTDVLIGSWNVTSVKYRQEIGTAYFTHKSVSQTGTFTFTADSTFHTVNYLYNISAGDSVATFADQLNQHGLYNVLNDDDLEVNDQVSGTFLTYQTLSRTSNTMTLIYQFKDLDLATNIRTVDRYTFDLVKM